MIEVWEIKYVYFIYIGKRLVYIGRSQKPFNRLATHRRNWLSVGNFKFVVYGPYSSGYANTLESCEIRKREGNKYFLSKTNVTNGNYQKISVKDSGCKTVFLFREGIQVKKMVG